jgi:hypothetical protein
MNQGRYAGADRSEAAPAEQANVSQTTGSRAASEGTDADLFELLRALTERQPQTRVAKRLGVDRKTLAKGLERQYLTPRLKSALETERQAVKRAEADALEARMARLETALQDLGGELRGEWRAEWRAWRAELAALRDELDALKVDVLGPDPASSPDEPLGGTLAEPDEGYVPRRLYPQLAAVEPAPDDEEVYRSAWPLVQEWREQREAFREGWPHPTGREAEVRMLELELRLIEQHRLTLPPDRLPWDEFARRDELRLRQRKLTLARRKLGRARLRRRLLRILTLGRRGAGAADAGPMLESR